MSKKRKCRMTTEELAIHEEAVRLRKMTDRQLVETYHRAAEEETAVSPSLVGEGAMNGDTPNENTSDVQKLLNAILDGKCKGMASVAAYKIAQLATEMGLM